MNSTLSQQRGSSFMSDEEFRATLEAAKAGRKEALVRLFEEFMPNTIKVVGAVRKSKNVNENEGEDLRQAVWLKVYVELEKNLREGTLRRETRGGLGLWIMEVARNEAIDHIRKVWRAQGKIKEGEKIELSIPGVEVIVVQLEEEEEEKKHQKRLSDALWQCIRELDRLDAHIFFLRHGQDFSEMDLHSVLAEEKEAENDKFLFFKNIGRRFIEAFPRPKDKRLSYKEIHAMLAEEEGFEDTVEALRTRYHRAKRRLAQCLQEHESEVER